MQSQTKIFSQLVRHFMRTDPVLVECRTTVAELLGRMSAAKATSAMVVDGDGQLAGIVTEQDVTRRIALRCDGEEPVADIMTSPVQSIGADDYLYFAIARMRRFGWRHMPVTDAEDRPLGIIQLTDALAVAGEAVLREIERVSHDVGPGGSLDGLREIKAAQVELAEFLFQDNVPAPEIQALISDINTDIHRRLLDGHLTAMADEGFGAPPVRFALIIMGSGGRGENYLYPDQDNGFILDDYPDARHAAVEAFFIPLAERLTRDLDAIGFPYCKGWVMATNPVWRKTRQQWRDQVQLWLHKRSAIALQYADIFFDFRGAWGALEMAGELRHLITEAAMASPAFLAALEQEIADHHVALGWFGRFVTETQRPELEGKINLKYGGTMPLVSNLRLLALREGVAATGTLTRLDVLHDKGVLDRDDWDYLTGAFRHITALLLRQQIRDFQAGTTVGNHVAPDDLSERERDMLVESLRAIDALRKRVHGEFTGDLF